MPRALTLAGADCVGDIEGELDDERETAGDVLALAQPLDDTAAEEVIEGDEEPVSVFDARAERDGVTVDENVGDADAEPERVLKEAVTSGEPLGVPLGEMTGERETEPVWVGDDDTGAVGDTVPHSEPLRVTTAEGVALVVALGETDALPLALGVPDRTGDFDTVDETEPEGEPVDEPHAVGAPEPVRDPDGEPLSEDDTLGDVLTVGVPVAV